MGSREKNIEAGQIWRSRDYNAEVEIIGKLERGGGPGRSADDWEGIWRGPDVSLETWQSESLGWIPEAVLRRLYRLVYQPEQEWEQAWLRHYGFLRV